MAEIPAAATAPPGVWYSFTADKGKAKTQEYYVCTFVGPGNPNVVAPMTSVGKYVAWDVQAKSGSLKYGGTASASSVAPTPTYATVYSAYMEPRQSEPNPHNGTDIGVVNGTNVYAMQAGVVVAAVAPGTGLKYVVVGHGLKLSPAGDPNLRYQYYSTYLHLSSIQSGVAVNTSVSAGQKIGQSGNSGTDAYHLDFGFCVGGGAGSDITTLADRLAMPLKYFLPSLVGSWNSGFDLDVAQPPRAWYDQNEGTMVDVVAYPADRVGSEPLVLTLYYRIAGSGGAWSTSSMFKTGTGLLDPFRGYFGSAVDNQTVEYWIKVARPTRTSYWSSRPFEKASSQPSHFYTTIARPPIGGLAVAPADSGE